MLLFIDSADPTEIKTAWDWGIIDGVTTNPSLAAKSEAARSGKSYKEIVSEILSIVDGPVSLETIATDYDGILKEARALHKLSKNVIVKIPCTQDGFKATKALSAEKIRVNMTLCFSVNQALLAAKVGAYYVSPFIGRLDDIQDDLGDQLIEDIVQVYQNYNFETKILDASIRDTEHVARSAEMGADIATVPLKVLSELHKHPLTDKGLESFLADWKTSGLELPI